MLNYLPAKPLAGCISISRVSPQATATIELPSVTQSPTATSLPTPASTASSTNITAVSVQTGTDRAIFIKETYPDYSSVAPGEKFTKTWDIKNIGSNTWSTNYKLVVAATPQNDSLGSPAEVNLRPRDIANMGFARAANVPVVLAGDIDRGGVIAQIVGTQVVIDPADAAMIEGFVINKFRGDVRLFDDGYTFIAERTKWRGFGVLPFFHIYGMVIILMHGLMRGASIVTMPRFEFEPFLKVLQDWPITSARRLSANADVVPNSSAAGTMNLRSA